MLNLLFPQKKLRNRISVLNERGITHIYWCMTVRILPSNSCGLIVSWNWVSLCGTKSIAHIRWCYMLRCLRACAGTLFTSEIVWHNSHQICWFFFHSSCFFVLFLKPCSTLFSNLQKEYVQKLDCAFYRQCLWYITQNTWIIDISFRASTPAALALAESNIAARDSTPVQGHVGDAGAHIGALGIEVWSHLMLWF